jgi:hypothetical protein
MNPMNVIVLRARLSSLNNDVLKERSKPIPNARVMQALVAERTEILVQLRLAEGQLAA